MSSKFLPNIKIHLPIGLVKISIQYAMAWLKTGQTFSQQHWLVKKRKFQQNSITFSDFKINILNALWRLIITVFLIFLFCLFLLFWESLFPEDDFKFCITNTRMINVKMEILLWCTFSCIVQMEFNQIHKTGQWEI